MKRGTVILCVLVFFTSLSIAGENPFARFVGKPYGTYHYAIRDSMRKRYDSNNYPFVMQTVAQLRQLPDVLNDGQWQLEADFLEVNYIHDYRGGSNQVFLARLDKMLQTSRKCGNRAFQVRILRRLLDHYIDSDLLETVKQALLLEEALYNISLSEYPDAVDCEYRLAEIYLKHRDYLRVKKLCLKILESPVFQQNQRIFIHARNCLGIVYRDYYRDYDRSDYWYRTIIDFDRKYHIKELPEQWKAIVKGELGINEVLRGHYPNARKLMEESIRVMYEAKDYTFCYSQACYLADCCCVMNAPAQAARYVAIADSCFRRSPVPVSRQMLFMAKSKLYGKQSRPDLAGRYLDSAFVARDNWDLKYNMKPFLLIEQQLAQVELQNKAEQSRANYRKYLFILFGSIVLMLALGIYLVLYIQKSRAYRALVLKNQQWAEAKPVYLEKVDVMAESVGPDEEVIKADDGSPLIMQLQKYLERTECYCHADLTLDYLSKKLGVNRSYISSAINATDSNFNSFINHYRVRMAIRILTDSPEKSVEEIALSVGFANRKSFYNAFRSITGLSPTQFRNNMEPKAVNS